MSAKGEGVAISGVTSVLLTCLLCYLKVNGHMDISWAMAFLPLWIGPAIIIVVFFVAVFFQLLTAVARRR